jgi:hypothetical protein
VGGVLICFCFHVIADVSIKFINRYCKLPFFVHIPESPFRLPFIPNSILVIRENSKTAIKKE